MDKHCELTFLASGGDYTITKTLTKCGCMCCKYNICQLVWGQSTDMQTSESRYMCCVCVCVCVCVLCACVCMHVCVRERQTQRERERNRILELFFIKDDTSVIMMIHVHYIITSLHHRSNPLKSTKDIALLTWKMDDVMSITITALLMITQLLH